MSFYFYQNYSKRCLILGMQFLKNPGFIIRIAIAVGYILLSILLLYIPNSSTILSQNMLYLFCALLMAYGIFRLYRAYLLYKETEEYKRLSFRRKR